MRIYKDVKSVNEPILQKGQWYIYVLENKLGNIKIGISTNMKQRIQSLSGSNSGGYALVKCAVSDATYLYSIEESAHTHFCRYKLGDTEWFRGDAVTFDEAVGYIDSLFASSSYHLCNDTRKKYFESSKTL